MRRKIVVATAVVAVITILVGIGAVVVIRRGVQIRAEEEMARQARVTAQQIDDDLERFEVRPGSGAASALTRYRTEIARSLERARTLGGHDIVEATITVRGRETPLGADLEVIPELPPDLANGEVTTVDVNGVPMLVVVEEVEIAVGTLRVAIGREQPVVASGIATVPLLVALSVGGVLTITLGVWFSRSVAARLKRLESTAAAVGSGDLSARADVSGNDEIAAVGTAMNTMTHELAQVRSREREFLMSVGHDLRTPLTTIRGYAEALESGAIDSDDLERVAGIVDRQSRLLSRLIEDLMLLARLESRQFELQVEQVDVSSVVREVADTYADRAASERVNLAATVEDVGEHKVDPDRLIQVLTNLIENAIRYTPELGEIDVSCRPRGLGFEVEVRNTGPGIDAADLDHVFERLYVADRYRAIRPSGSGLGLAIVSELVAAMDGSVTCTSEPGSWTSVRVTF